jgi:hypothetical protein
MDFDFGRLKEGLTTLGSIVGIYKQIKDSLPDGLKKDEIDEALKKAERQLKLAESQIAQGLGYQLCKNHFPPIIMLSADDKKWKCSECGYDKDTGPAGMGFDGNKGLRGKSKWSIS